MASIRHFELAGGRWDCHPTPPPCQELWIRTGLYRIWTSPSPDARLWMTNALMWTSPAWRAARPGRESGVG